MCVFGTPLILCPVYIIETPSIDYWVTLAERQSSLRRRLKINWYRKCVGVIVLCVFIMAREEYSFQYELLVMCGYIYRRCERSFVVLFVSVRYVVMYKCLLVWL